MNKLTIISILFLLSFGFITQAKGQTLSNRQTEQIKNQVDSMFQKMVVLAEKLEFNELSSGVNDTREAGFITNGKYYARYSSLIEDDGREIAADFHWSFVYEKVDNDWKVIYSHQSTTR